MEPTIGAMISKPPPPLAIPATTLDVVLAYAISWTRWIPLAVMGENVTRGDAWPSHVPGLMGPLAAALLAFFAIAIPVTRIAPPPSRCITAACGMTRTSSWVVCSGRCVPQDVIPSRAANGVSRRVSRDLCSGMG